MMSKNKVSAEELSKYEGDGNEGVFIDYARIINVTDKGALLDLYGDETWVPRGQIMSADHEAVEVTNWWAKKNWYA
jgi:hypothetical protein